MENPLTGMSMRLPPHNVQAEQSLLGALLANPKAYDRVADFLEPKHFYDPIHARIYEAIVKRVSRGMVADPVTLREDLGDGTLEEVGGVGYLAQLLAAMVGIVNAGDYGRVICDAWVRREMLGVAERLIQSSFSPEPGETAIAIGERIVEELEQRFDGAVPFVMTSIGQALDQVLDAMDDARNGVVQKIYSTGDEEIDAIIGRGMAEEDLIVLAGRPGHGKSALALQKALSFVKAYKLPVLYFSLEMPAKELGIRAISLLSGIPAFRIASGNVSAPEADLLLKTRNEFRSLPFVIDDRARLTMPQIRMAIRRFKRLNQRIGLIVVDHMHLIKMENSNMKLGLAFAQGDIANDLKGLAKEYHTPVLALAQLNRGVDGREDKEPNMSDLKNSGDIEAAADSILFVYRPELYLAKSKPVRRPGESDSEFYARELSHNQAFEEAKGKAHIVSGKCRRGPVGAVQRRFDGPTTRFSPLD